MKNPISELLLRNDFCRIDKGHYINENCEIRIFDTSFQITHIGAKDDLEKYLKEHNMIKRDLTDNEISG